MSIEFRNGTGIKDGRYVVNAICHNCREWNSGSIDFGSTTQPMIYAVGPGDLYLSTNAKDAGLRRHDFWGTFTIDLQAAKGDLAQFPPKELSNQNAAVVDHEHNDHEYSSSLHAVAMAGTFVIIFPVGVFYQKVLRTVRWHWITQAFGVIVVLVGAGLGLGMSQDYNRVSRCLIFHTLSIYEESFRLDLSLNTAYSPKITTAPISLSALWSFFLCSSKQVWAAFTIGFSKRSNSLP